MSKDGMIVKLQCRRGYAWGSYRMREVIKTATFVEWTASLCVSSEAKRHVFVVAQVDGSCEPSERKKKKGKKKEVRRMFRLSATKKPHSTAQNRPSPDQATSCSPIGAFQTRKLMGKVNREALFCLGWDATWCVCQKKKQKKKGDNFVSRPRPLRIASKIGRTKDRQCRAGADARNKDATILINFQYPVRLIPATCTGLHSGY